MLSTELVVIRRRELLRRLEESLNLTSELRSHLKALQQECEHVNKTANEFLCMDCGAAIDVVEVA
jgi:hypothetical protein